MATTPERAELAPGFTISRVLTGLWQVADMERGGDMLDAEAAADVMAEYVGAGLSTFDMAARARCGQGDTTSPGR